MGYEASGVKPLDLNIEGWGSNAIGADFLDFNSRNTSSMQPNQFDYAKSFTQQGGPGGAFGMPGIPALGADADGPSSKNPFFTMKGFGEGLNVASGLLTAFNGYQENKLGRDTLAFQKTAFNKQFDYSKELTEERRNRHKQLRSAYANFA